MFEKKGINVFNLIKSYNLAMWNKNNSMSKKCTSLFTQNREICSVKIEKYY